MDLSELIQTGKVVVTRPASGQKSPGLEEEQVRCPSCERLVKPEKFDYNPSDFFLAQRAEPQAEQNLDPMALRWPHFLQNIPCDDWDCCWMAVGPVTTGSPADSGGWYLTRFSRMSP